MFGINRAPQARKANKPSIKESSFAIELYRFLNSAALRLKGPMPRFDMRPVLLSIALIALSHSYAAKATTELHGTAMLSALKGGGYVVYLRHDRSDTSRSDADPI